MSFPPLLSPSTSSSSSPTSPAARPLSDSSEAGEHCSYSSYWCTQCLNGSCDSQQRRFRQCEGRPREELVTKEDGSERWVKAEEGAGQSVGDGQGLSVDVGFPDPFVSLFDEVRAQTQLMGQAFRDAFAQPQARWPQSASPTAGRREGSGEGAGGKAAEGEGAGGNDDLLRGSLLSGLVDVLHGLSRTAVDGFFDRGSSDVRGRGETSTGKSAQPPTVHARAAVCVLRRLLSHLSPVYRTCTCALLLLTMV